MTQIPDNLPAFPVSSIDGFTQHGMSLRDWFAGQAMVMSMPDSPKHLADWAYRVADAMLAERAKS